MTDLEVFKRHVGYRIQAAQEGFSIEASDLGKVKMLVQIISIVTAIIHHHWQWLEAW